MDRLREPIGQTPWQRVALAAGGIVLVGGGVLYALIGGWLLVPVGVVAVTLAVVPARWSLRRGLVAGVLALPALFALGGASYVGYSCVRPEPWLDVRFKEGEGSAIPLTEIANREESATSSQGGDGPDEHRLFFERDAAGVRDRVARELRADPAVAAVQTGEEHCD